MQCLDGIEAEVNAAYDQAHAGDKFMHCLAACRISTECVPTRMKRLLLWFAGGCLVLGSVIFLQLLYGVVVGERRRIQKVKQVQAGRYVDSLPLDLRSRFDYIPEKTRAIRDLQRHYGDKITTQPGEHILVFGESDFTYGVFYKDVGTSQLISRVIVLEEN